MIAFVVLFPVLILVMLVRPITRRASAPSESTETLDETAFLAVMSPLLNAQLERAGNEASVVQAEETAAAVFAATGHVQREEYGAVIISARGEHEGDREGYALLDAMRPGGDHATPLFVYTDLNGEDHRLEALNRGAQDATSRPIALFDMVTRSLV